jgi:type I restriction enzyme S subunit
MSTRWPEVNLGEVLVERREEPDLVAMETGQIRVVEKIPFNSGRLEFRQEGKTKTGMISIQPGDLVVSGINAAKGAIAIYDSSEQVPAAATIHYSAYAIKEDRADRRFLWWLLRSNTFREILKDHVPGGIKTELKAKRLLAVPIPLPSLPEQRRIVVKIEQVAAKIGLAHGIHLHATEEAEALVGSFFRRIAADTLATGTLGDVLACPPKNGWSARCDNAEDGTPILTLAAVTGYQYRATEFKRTSMFTKPDAHYWLQPGDLLITRSNTPELVGHAAIYSGAPFPCIYPDLMMRLSPRESAVERRFVWYWLQSPVARDFIERTAKGTSPTMRKISQSNVMGIPFPTSLPLVEQRRIAAKLDALQARMECLKAFQAQTAAELDALLPSILDRTLSGRL